MLVFISPSPLNSGWDPIHGMLSLHLGQVFLPQPSIEAPSQMILEVVCLLDDTRFFSGGDQYYEGKLLERNHDYKHWLTGWDCSGVERAECCRPRAQLHLILSLSLSPLNSHVLAHHCVRPNILWLTDKNLWEFINLADHWFLPTQKLKTSSDSV